MKELTDFQKQYFEELKEQEKEELAKIEFTSHFLSGNPLVFEYFQGEYPPHIHEVLKK